MADIFTDLIKDTADAISGKRDNLWSQIMGGDARAYGITLMMDAIISKPLLRDVYETVMLSASARQVVRNTKLGQIVPSANSAFSSGLQAANNIGFEATAVAAALTDVALVDTAGAAALISLASPELQEIWEKTLIEPNIEGVPISTATLDTNREVDVGEQMMIVQSTGQKQYWTDNAVPKLKEWTVNGYITTQMILDSAFLVKPSLRLQHDFLDVCAASRRPVLFKDNRGDFRFVQIMNLQTSEEASYNNAIKVTISLREYKPFEVVNKANSVDLATTDPSILPAGVL